MHGTISTAELIKERVADSERAPIKLAHLAQLEAESITSFARRSPNPTIR